MNMLFKREIPSPEEIRAMYPLSKEAENVKAENDRALREIFLGDSEKLLVVIGPCSADREDAVLEYVSRLKRVSEEVKDKLLIVPRIYVNKPRTTGDGYKGMLYQPDPKNAPDVLLGLVTARRLSIEVMEETGFSPANEMLYPEAHQYLADCLSYVAVGARSVENQLHRLTASGLDIPVGMKNPTGGQLSVMVNAINAARHPHTFLYAGWEVESKGNPMAHAVLRGYANKHNRSVPNYHYEDLLLLSELYEESGLSNPAVIVDTNHANSGKHWAEQPRIAYEVIHSMRSNPSIGKMVKGLMVESYLEDGCQTPDESVYGKSITDPCLGWEKTEEMLYRLADMI